MVSSILTFVCVFILFVLIVGYGYYNRNGKTTVDESGGSTVDPPNEPGAPNDAINEADPDNEFDDPKADRSPPSRIVAYYTNWARYRKDAPCLPTDIPVEYVTDIVYAFFPVNDDGLVRYSDPWSDINLNGISETTGLRGRGKIKKVLFSIGGWTYSGPEKKKWYLDKDSKPVVNTKSFQQIWSEILSTSKKREVFIDSAIEMMKRHDFDGIDIDYEYPACPQGDCRPEYKDQGVQFIELLKLLRSKIGAGKMITLATAAADKNVLTGPNMKQITDIVDYLNVMTYDYFVWFDGAESGHNQPKRETSDNFNVNHTLWRYMKIGCDPKKLNIGVACYGRGFQISKPNLTKAIASKRFSNIKSIGSSHPSTWTQEKGVVAFYEFKKEYPNARSIFVSKEGSWLYDSATSEIISYTDLFDLKAINEIRIRKKIGGILIYALDQDDYMNLNGFGRYPLLRNMLNIDALAPTSNMIK